jgi:hypothetical protein
MYRLSIPPYMNKVNRAVVLCKKFEELQVFFRIEDLYHKLENPPAAEAFPEYTGYK